MKAEYINPFIASFEIVVGQVLNENIERGSLYLKNGSSSKNNVVISIGITGDLRGNLMMSMNKNTAMNIASKMMGGMEVIEFEDMAKSAVSELGNMIAGNATSNFYEIGKKIDITPPLLYVGEGISTFNRGTSLCIPMQIANDLIEIDVIMD